MSSKDSESQAEKLATEGLSQIKSGDYDQGIQSLLTSADLYSHDSNYKEQAKQLLRVAEIYQLIRRFDPAMKIYRTLSGLLEQLHDDDTMIRVLSNMGLLQAMQGQFSDALDYFHKALDASERIGNRQYMAQQLGNIGSVYRDMKEHNKALENYNKSLPIYQELGHGEGIADQCTNIAYIYAMENNPQEALYWFKKALPIYKELKKEEKAGFTQQNIANLEKSLEQPLQKS